MKPDPKRDALLQELHTRLQALYGERLDRLVLFGSHVRGDNREESDIDLMVVLKGKEIDVYEELSRLMDVIYPLELEHRELISVIPVGSADYAAGSSALLRNVRREGISITTETE